MKAPYSWLKEYVDIELSPEDLAERLTLSGLEVDRVEYPWPGIVTAEIIWLERVAGSDHLSATRVSTGDEEFSVVCGAPNIKLHDRVPLARIGAKVGEITIQEKKAMGVLSQGMLCSPRELGLSDDHDGILILPPDTPLGVPFGKIRGDAVIDLDIKAHRGDLFCMLGIAREIAAFTGATLRPPTIAVKEKGAAASKLMRLDVRDPDLCPRYTARVVRNVAIGPSPQWLAERLTAAGMRPINNVVDITNYVMLELGQPLHAFDYDLVADHTIIVRRAEAGEQITTLDDVTRALTPDMLMIADPAGSAVIAGIFGGARVEVTPTTTSVLLEAAHFNPINIRRTSQAIGLRTESSGRFEKNPDIALTEQALDRAAQLLIQLANGQVAPGRVDFYPTPAAPREIRFHLQQVAWLTGMEVTPLEAIAVLRGLGFGVAEEPNEQGVVILRVTVPSWRGDVEESADLVEEVARIVGYDRIPNAIPTGPLPEPTAGPWFDREEQLREALVGAGLTETVSYPLISRTVMARLLSGSPGDEALLSAPIPVGEASPGGSNANGAALTAQQTQKLERRRIEAIAEKLPAITLHNPLSADMESLRLTLMASLLTTLRENMRHESAGCWFFEVGRRYLLTPELVAGAGVADERRTVGVVLSGPAAQSWLGERDADFFDLKGVAELLLRAVGVAQYRFTPTTHPTFHPGRCALLEVMAPMGGMANEEGDAHSLTAGGVWAPIGVLGEVHPEVAGRFDLTRRAYLLELDLERLYSAQAPQARHQPVARYPAAQRDIALVIRRDIPEAAVAATIRAHGGELLRRVRLFDVYTGEGIPAEKHSLAYALTYQSATRTLTDQEVERAQAAVTQALAATFGAELRS